MVVQTIELGWLGYATNNVQVEEGLGDSSHWFTMVYLCSKTGCNFDTPENFWAHAHMFVQCLLYVFQQGDVSEPLISSIIIFI